MTPIHANPGRVQRRLMIAGAHAAFAIVAYGIAFGLRFDFAIPAGEQATMLLTLPVVLLVRLLSLEASRVPRGSWRHFGMLDLRTLTIAVSVGSLLMMASGLALERLVDRERFAVPLSVFILEWLVFMSLAAGARFATRLAHEGHLSLRHRPGRATLVIGAGDAAERFMRQTLHDAKSHMRFVGLLDDGPWMQGRSLHGVPVVGTIDTLSEQIAARGVEQVVIAIPSAKGEQMRRIVRLCAGTGIDFRILPSLQELLDGRAQIGETRQVQIEDLLGRPPVHLDLDRVERDIAGCTVLVTGGAGSIGSELARQVAGFAPARLILLEQAESPLYFVHLELSRAYPGLDVVPVVADVADAGRMEQVFAQYQPDYVFHAAAYKHVPMMERHPAEAVRNNVFGTLRVAECAARHGARKFVLISTDKAVNPSSVMGTTKRLAERIVLGLPSLRASSTDFRAVRFGNVLGSDGSVIPLFKRQIAAGGPLTVTDPEVRRYFMTIPEAVQLVLQAAALPEAKRRISMLDMGEPVRIVDLAEQLVRLSGLVPYRDVQIVFTGLRPGEKLNEELMSLFEESVPTEVDAIRVVQTDDVGADELLAGMRRLAATIEHGEREDVVEELRMLVPEFQPAVTTGVPVPVRVGEDIFDHARPERTYVPTPVAALPVRRGPVADAARATITAPRGDAVEPVQQAV